MNRINIITLAVADMDKAIAFYIDGLGFKSRNTNYTRYNPKPTIFINTDGGVIFELTPTSIQEKALNRKMREHESMSGIMLSYLCKDIGEVDEILQKAKTAGAVNIVPPVEYDWGGYMGHFTDLDGYDWAVTYDPVAQFDANGNLADYE